MQKLAKPLFLIRQKNSSPPLVLPDLGDMRMDLKWKGTMMRAISRWIALAAVMATPSAAEESERKCLRPTSLFVWNGCRVERSVGSNSQGPLATDRPDFTEASTTVGLGRAQIESGYTFTFDNQAGTRLHSHRLPEFLLRVGVLAEWFEMRVGWNYGDDRAVWVDGSSRATGSEDLYLGCKLKLTEQQGALPEMVLLPQASVPLGAGDLTGDELLPGLNWLYGWDVTENVTLAGSTQFNRAKDAMGHSYTEWAQSATTGISLSEQLGTYFEYFGLYPHSAAEAGVGAEHYLNGGVTWLVNDDLQFDIRAGFGLNARASDFFTGAGFAYRF